jgi:Glycosyl hydrolases family 28
MKHIIFAVLFFLFSAPFSCLAKFQIAVFGAKGDGLANDTKAIQQAIDKATQAGGGIVVVKSGTYKIGTLVLKSNVNLHLEPGAVLLGSPDYKDYTEVIQQFESRTNYLYAKYFMLYAEGATNISVTGSGTIDGNGKNNFQVVRPQNLRPFSARFTNCSNVIVRDVNFEESANWTLHLLGCKDVTIDNISINHSISENRDGIDIDCCERVTVSNSRLNTGDDAIVMKSTSGTLCQDIVISNCIITTRASAIKTGTESNGGFKNITVSNCIIKNIPVHAGIELMSVDGGVMEHILIENIIMDNVATPFFIRAGIRARPFKKGQYVQNINDVKDITLNNISALNAKLPSSIMGLHNRKIKNISIKNYTVSYTATQADQQFNTIPFEEFSYPMAIMFTGLPAYGLYCRNVDGLQLRSMEFFANQIEKRNAFVFDRCSNVYLNDVAAEIKNNETAMAYIRNTNFFKASLCSSAGNGKSLFETEKNNCSGISFMNNWLQKGQKEILYADSLPDKSIFDDFTAEAKYSVATAKKIDGLPAYNLKDSILSCNFNIINRGSLQLCLLVKNTSSQPAKLLVKYEDVQQEFVIDWKEWGWAPVSLLRQFPTNKKVSFEIISENKNSRVYISKVYLRHHDVGYTD